MYHGDIEAATARGLRELRNRLEEVGISPRTIDQILHLPKETVAFSGRGGVVDFYRSEAAISDLYTESPPDKNAFTYEMSDHLPLWLEVNTNILDERLDQIIKSA